MTNDPKATKNTFYTVYTNVPSPTSDLIWFITLDVGKEMVFRENCLYKMIKKYCLIIKPSLCCYKINL